MYRPNDAFLIVAGDVTQAKGKQIAEKLLDGWSAGPLVSVDYNLPSPATKRKIILIDNPEGKQSVVEMAERAYDLHTDEKFPGSVAGQILSAGIESRLGRYVRAEKGYSYGVLGYFRPGRQAGVFAGSTETAFETTVPAIEAMWKVFGDMKKENVTDAELKEAKMRVSGSTVMSVQTIGQQADRRGDGILNGYPIDYYDKYPERIGQVMPDQIRDVMNKYVDPDRMTIIVVAPAEKVKEQLEKLGEVEVRPMPSKRGKAATQPSEDKEMLKKAA
jgi:predicted Zn-dependent peptidase